MINKNSNNWCGGVLALDLGEKRVGAALSRSGIIAEPYETLDFNDDFFGKLKKICRTENIIKIIVGLPKSLRGEINAQEKKTRRLAQKIRRETKIKVLLFDESFSTKIAKERFGGERKDEESAVVILENYLEENKK